MLIATVIKVTAMLRGDPVGEQPTLGEDAPSAAGTETVFLNFYGDQESIPATTLLLLGSFLAPID
jgi:hypothetical protein